MEAKGIGQLLAAVMAEVDAVGKNRRNEAQRYAFRGIDDFMNALHPVLAKHGVVLRPHVVECKHLDSCETKNGGVMFRVSVTMDTAFCAPSPCSACACRPTDPRGFSGSDSGAHLPSGVMSDDTERDVLALELVLELAEPGIPSVPTPDRREWIEACLRVRRLVLELRAGLRPGPAGGLPRCSAN